MGLPTDTTGQAHVWRMLHELNEAANGVSPDAGVAFGFKAIVVLCAVLFLAVVMLGCAFFLSVRWGLNRYIESQSKAMAAISGGKDASRKEVTAILNRELSINRETTAAALSSVEEALSRHSALLSDHGSDLRMIAHKTKLPLSVVNGKPKDSPSDV